MDRRRMCETALATVGLAGAAVPAPPGQDPFAPLPERNAAKAAYAGLELRF